MPHKNSLNLAGYDDIFGSTVTAPNGESVVTIPLTELHPPEFYPFQVNEVVCYRGYELPYHL